MIFSKWTNSENLQGIFWVLLIFRYSSSNRARACPTSSRLLWLAHPPLPVTRQWAQTKKRDQAHIRTESIEEDSIDASAPSEPTTFVQTHMREKTITRDMGLPLTGPDESEEGLPLVSKTKAVSRQYRIQAGVSHFSMSTTILVTILLFYLGSINDGKR